MTRRGIVCAGNWLIDTVKTLDRFPPEGELAQILRTDRAAGGACNLLFDLAKLRTDLPLWGCGCVGEDEGGRWLSSELERLNRCCTNRRDRAILHFLRSTGCRISEVTELDRSVVNIESLECVVHGKGNKERTVYLDDVAGMVLAEYLDSRTDDNPALFVNRYKERMQPGGVREMLNKLAEAAGVDHVHPHKFRRTLATNMSRHGMPIQEVAKILGHEKLDTTMKYVVLNKDDVKASYRRFA